MTDKNKKKIPTREVFIVLISRSFQQMNTDDFL